MSKEIENVGLPTALITTLVTTALFTGAYRIVPGCGINHPLGNPTLPTLREKDIRRRIVLTALESLGTEVSGSKVFNWKDS
jgi:glycine/betaine/sarcosine/D-proline reductase family selenoprotein B